MFNFGQNLLAGQRFSSKDLGWQLQRKSGCKYLISIQLLTLEMSTNGDIKIGEDDLGIFLKNYHRSWNEIHILEAKNATVSKRALSRPPTPGLQRPKCM